MLSYKHCLVLREKAREEGAHGGDIGHTNYFMVSGSKILEGVGSYVMVAIDMKSFNEWIMVGQPLLFIDKTVADGFV